MWNTFPTPVCILSYMYTSAVLLRQLHSNFEDFNNEVCCVMRITRAESDPRHGTLNKHSALAPTFWLDPIRC